MSMNKRENVVQVIENGKVISEVVMTRQDKTKQKIGQEYDLNRIMARYKRTGELRIELDEKGQYIDTVGLQDFNENMNKITNITKIFEKFPSSVRAKFDGNVAKFSEYMGNVVNGKVPLKEAEELGIIKITKKEVQKSVKEGEPKP